MSLPASSVSPSLPVRYVPLDDDLIEGEVIEELIEPVRRLSADLREAILRLKGGDARYLIKNYYTIQDYRIRLQHQMRAASKEGEPVRVMEYLHDGYERMEGVIKQMLGYFVRSRPEGEWLLSIIGIGPVLAAATIAYVDVTRYSNVSKVWAAAGLDPTRVWNKGEKRPWNADFKRICYLIGESFIKSSSRPEAYYGHLYQQYKAVELQRNNMRYNREQCRYEVLDPTKQSAFADQAAKRFYRTHTDAYQWQQRGMLAPAHIIARARRKAVKMYLSHAWDMFYRIHYQKEPPLPWIIAQGKHADFMPPPSR